MSLNLLIEGLFAKTTLQMPLEGVVLALGGKMTIMKTIFGNRG